MAQRLPTPGKDNGTWGGILNDFLEVALNTDGTLRTSAITGSGGVTSVNHITPINGAVTLTPSDIGAPTTLSALTDVNSTGAANNQVLAYDSSTEDWVASTVSSSTISNATNGNLGIIQLAGDLGGNDNAASPAISAGAITGAKIASDTITDANISASAAIASTKISGLGTAAALDAGAANGVASLNGSGVLPLAQGGTGSATQNFVDLSTDQTVDGVKTFGSTIGGNISGNAATVTTNADLTGDVTSVGNATTLAKIKGVTTPSSAPSEAGQVLTTTSTTATAWTTPSSGSSTLAADTDVSITSPTSNQVLAYDSGTEHWTNQTLTKTFCYSQTWTVGGYVNIAQGDIDYINPLFVGVAGGQTLQLIGCYYIINDGTSATVEIERNGTVITGFSGISVTTTAGNTTPTAISLANGDMLQLVVTAINNSPENLSFSMMFQVTV